MRSARTATAKNMRRARRTPYFRTQRSLKVFSSLESIISGPIGWHKAVAGIVATADLPHERISGSSQAMVQYRCCTDGCALGIPASRPRREAGPAGQ
jgi:hypothetical protein